jgi:hypothetical protein
MRDVLETAGALVALALGICALAGIAGRVVVLPWIRTHLLEPVQETNRQVTVNGHVSEEPTLKDAVHTLQEKHDQLREAYGDLRRDIAAAAVMFDGHIAASERDRGDLWRAVGLLRGDDQHEPSHRKDDPL